MQFRTTHLALLAALSLPVISHAGVFTNGDFESPGGGTVFLSNSGDTYVTGWVHNGTGFESYSNGGNYGITAQSGTNYITFGHSGFTGGTLSQTFDTVAGQSYTVNYYLLLQQGLAITQSMSLEAFNAGDNSSLGSVTTNFDNTDNWALGTALTFTAASSSSTITFTDLTDGTSSGPVNWDLDTVTVSNTVAGSPAPEPATFVLLGGTLVAIGVKRFRSSASKLNS